MRLEIKECSFFHNETRLRAYLSGTYVASFTWSTDDGVIQSIWVHEDYRRRGIATKLYREARKRASGSIRHSSYRTQEGDDWAKAVGGYLPPKYGT